MISPGQRTIGEADMRRWAWEGAGILPPMPDIFVLTLSFRYQNSTEFDISAGVAAIVPLVLLEPLVLMIPPQLLIAVGLS
jgi:hypothetical protein